MSMNNLSKKFQEMMVKFLASIREPIKARKLNTESSDEGEKIAVLGPESAL